MTPQPLFGNKFVTRMCIYVSPQNTQRTMSKETLQKQTSSPLDKAEAAAQQATTPTSDTSTASGDAEELTASPTPPEDTAAPLAQAQQALAEAEGKYLRLYAEFENFRRREAKERIAHMATASRGVLEKLLPIADDFERALQALQADDTTQEGIRLIYDKLLQLLQLEGVVAMQVEPGTAFDPELHEAITHTPTEDPHLKGKVIDVVAQGFLLKDKVLRFAKVVIGK